MKKDILEKKIKNWSLAMGILYAFITLSFIGFYLGFLIIGWIGEGSSAIGISIWKATPFLYPFFFASLIICVISFLIFAHHLKPFGQNNDKKNHTVDVILFSILTFGFLDFVLALPMIYLWILLLKRIKLDNGQNETIVTNIAS